MQDGGAPRVLVTGGNGFVGAAVCARLRHDGVAAIGVVRGDSGSLGQVRGPDLAAQSDWRSLLSGCEVVVHTAARVHVQSGAAATRLDDFREVNVAGTLNVARHAAEVGVRRFVFISSIKVNGEASRPGEVFRATDIPRPEDAYAVSKFEAEQALQGLSATSGMELVIIRPPLVYGPGVKANFLNMMRWIERGVPLPLGSVTRNRRSLVALGNLVDLIVTCIDHPAAASQVFLAGDGEDVSTADLICRFGIALGVPVRLLPVPVWALHAGARLVGREALFQRLCGNLQVDISKARQLLGWKPQIGVDEGLRRVVAGFRR